MSTETLQPVKTEETGEGPDIPDRPYTGFFMSSEFDPYREDPASGDYAQKRDRWSVSWSDLMMTMFILFAVLYVYQAGNRRLMLGDGIGAHDIAQSGAGRVANLSALHNPTDIYDRAREAFLDEFVDNSVGVDMVSDSAVRISIAGDILFETGRAELLPQARERLLQIASVLRENTYIINVSGHTDSMPNYSDAYPTNWELSAARAIRTARFLIETGGVPEARFFVSAHSWHQPVRANDSAVNRRLNRRVEIVLMKDRPYLTSSP